MSKVKFSAKIPLKYQTVKDIVPSYKMTYLGSTATYNGGCSDVIYTVTSIFHKEGRRESRSWGWMPTLKGAQTAVRKNSADMHECMYNYCLIEQVPAGIIPIGAKVMGWYKWDPDPKDKDNFRGKWKRCPEPEWSKNTFGWSLG